MPSEYIPIFAFAVLVTALPVIAIRFASSPRQSSARGIEHEESVGSVGPGFRKPSFQYYIIAVLFVVSNAAVVVLFPWAVQLGSLGLYGLIAVFAFLGVLLVGYVWMSQKGAFDLE